MSIGDRPKSLARVPSPVLSNAEPLTVSPEILDKVSEILRPMLKDPTQLQGAAHQLVAFVETHSGPLPHPRILAGYDAAVPGSGREIVDMAKDEQKHRHSMERVEHIYPYVGVIIGGVALFACVGGSIYLAMHDKNTVALALMGAPFLGAIGLFVRSRMEPREKVAPGANTKKPSASPKSRRR